MKHFFTTLLLINTIIYSHAQQKRPPNVIIIMADDMGYGDVGFNGCKDIPTPNIDKIAKSGVVFTSGHVSFAVCSPSRAGLLTGRYSQRFGYERNILYVPSDRNMGLDLGEQTMADILGKLGYKTMLIGKWHLGSHEDMHPLKRGFDNFFGFLGGGHYYFPKELTIADPLSISDESNSYKTKLNNGNLPIDENEYITDAFSREAVYFIERNTSNNFFLYLSYNAPHTPLQAPDKYLSRFNNIADKKRRTYAAMVSAIDDGVGMILEKIKTNKIDQNTIIIFLSDNGGPIDNGSSNGNLNGKKGTLLEGGIRVPFAMKWTGVIPEGMIYEKPVISLDILPTILGQIETGNKPKHTLDGVNLMPYLLKGKKSAPHKILFWRNYDLKNYAAISADGKKLWMKGDSVLLFDLQKDVGENKNIVDENSHVVNKMKKQVHQWEKALKLPAFYGLSQRDLYFRNRK